MSGHDLERDAASLPADLESPRSKLVYLYLTVRGGATADELRDDLAMKKGAVLAIVGTLRDEGYVRHDDGEYVLG